MAIMGTIVVALSVSESPHNLLDIPKELFTESIDSLFPSLSGFINTSNGSIFSSEKLVSKSGYGLIKRLDRGIESVSESLLKSSSGSFDFSLDFCLSNVHKSLLLGILFWNSLHSEINGVLDELLLVVNVLDVKLLTVLEDVIVLFNGDSLLEATISIARSLSPRASVASFDDIIILAVLEAVRHLDPLPSLFALSNKFSKLASFFSSPSGKSVSLGLLECFKHSGVRSFSGFASSELFLGVGNKVVGFSLNAELPGASDVSESLAE